MNTRILRPILAPLNDRLDVTALITIIALTLIVTFGSTLRYKAFADSEVPRYPNGDAAKYLLYGYNLKNFGIYSKSGMALLPADTDYVTARNLLEPDALVTPGYPLFLSRFLGGEYSENQRDRILFTQVVLSSLTVLLAYLAFAPVSRVLALGVATLTALSPHLVNLNLFFLTETLFCFLLVSVVWLLSLVSRHTTWPLFLLLGLVFAMATLTRPWIQGFLFILIPYLIFFGVKAPPRNALLVLLGAAILITPWLVRNKISTGTSADPTLSVTSIHHGMYPDMMFEKQPESLGYAYKYDPKSADFSKSLNGTLGELKRRVAERPREYFNWYVFGKTKSVLSWKMIAAADAVFVYHVNNSPYFAHPVFYLSSYYMQQIHAPLMVLAILGVLLVWLPRPLQHVSQEALSFLRAASLFVLYFLVMHSIGAPYPRYSVPMRPILYGMSLLPILFVARFVKLHVDKRRA